MDNLVTSEYFYGEINISNLNKDENSDSLDVDITKYQKEILLELLGYSLYKEFDEAIIAGDPAQKWIDLRDGAEFTFEFRGKTLTRKWNGLQNSDKISLISDYTYYKYKERKATETADSGERIPKTENAIPASPADKMVNAWFRMRELYGITPRGFDSLSDADYIFFNALSSCYNFLLANQDTYSGWEFKPKISVNVFDY